MICAWKYFLDVLPPWLREETDKLGFTSLQELRMRVNAPPELVLSQGPVWLDRHIHEDDISLCINLASHYSPWAATTISRGYLTTQGGHRIGICGEAVCINGMITGMKHIRSICIRIARDFPGIAEKINIDAKSILILGTPGSGKTTLLRDLIRIIGKRETVCVVDERGELFPEQFPSGRRVDVLTGCRKNEGLDIVMRTMGPDRVAVDEITAMEDAEALINVLGCGVGILATAHASSVDDMKRRPIYQKLWNMALFDSIVVMHADKTYHEERICL